MAAGGPGWIVYRTEEAEDEYRALSRRRDGKRVLKSLTEGPSTGGSRETQEHPGVYRVHVPGRWRILFSVEQEARRIRVIRIRPRGTVYIGYERRQRG